jgi:hypothetical protein
MDRINQEGEILQREQKSLESQIDSMSKEPAPLDFSYKTPSGWTTNSISFLSRSLTGPDDEQVPRQYKPYIDENGLIHENKPGYYYALEDEKSDLERFQKKFNDAVKTLTSMGVSFDVNWEKRTVATLDPTK